MTKTAEPAVQCSAWLPVAMVQRLEERAAELSLTRSSYIRMLLLQALNQRDREGR